MYEITNNSRTSCQLLYAPKNEIRVILNILYSCKSVAMKFSKWYPDWLYNLPPHLGYVSTLPDITQKSKSYVIFLSIVWVALIRTGFGVLSGYLSKITVCSKWRPFAFYAAVFVNDFVNYALQEYGPKCQWASASARQCRVSVIV